MTKASYIILCVLCAIGLNACSSFEPDPVITSGEEVSLMVDHNTVMTYDPLCWQHSYRNISNIYRVFSDDMSEQYKLVSSDPIKAAGQEVSCKLEWTKDNHSEVRENLKFTVQRLDKAGDTAWLWCRKQRIGIAVIL